jgi:hypothetical protein
MQPQNTIHSPFAACILPPAPKNFARTVQYPYYAREILDASGICYHFVELADLSALLPSIRILLTVGETALADDIKQALRDWVAGGGMWISVAGVCGLEDLFGVVPEGPSYSAWGGGQGMLGEGYLRPAADHYVTGHVRIPLHFFNGLPVTAGSGQVLASVLDCHGRPLNRAGLVSNRAGKGHAILCAVDITGTVVRIQQGHGAVTRDGVSAPDGTAPLADDALKTGDGHVLDWYFDRLPVPGVEGLSVFLEPIADQWRELLLRCIFHAINETKACVPLLWLYPHDLPAIAHLSLDTDHNVPEQGRAMLDLLNKNKVHATWCTILPGYEKSFMREIASTGHELAMHYDAVSDDWHWGRPEFARQWRELTALFDDAPIVTNKNHYLRWEGDCDLWNWCEEHGIELDQTKGASKTGEAGFNFGTCRPYFPVDFAGRPLNVLELPTPTQDLDVFAPRAIAAPLLDAVVRTHGIMHQLFHPAHVDKPGVPDAIEYLVQLARDAGLEWWTAAQINHWERARRKVKLRIASKSDVSVTSPEALQQVTILWLNGPGKDATVDGQPANPFSTTRWGLQFSGLNVDLQKDTQTKISFH